MWSNFNKSKEAWISVTKSKVPSWFLPSHSETNLIEIKNGLQNPTENNINKLAN
jgi:hypothetical protein